MKIIVAKDAGYCFGVRDAVNIAYETTKKYGSIYMLGDIVHNEKVVADLAKAGTKVVENLEDIPSDSPILFRAHGTSTPVWEKAKSRNMDIIDATCPLVHEIHNEVKKLDKEGRHIIVVGDHGHDEVLGISSQVQNVLVIATPEEASKLPKMKRAGVVCQSTQTIENVQEIINILMTKVFDLHFVNTICFPTKRNQEQIKILAEKCDIMLIIGSFTSANSKRLTQLSSDINKNSYQVTCADDLNPDWFTGAKTIGISAGASTPDYIINEVKKKLKELGNKK
ncbi:MAG: 4-hydroxy-3-methylbut-2-enyl diphosphate reductase [Candidatus Marinimicrobia bacterium]|nr:4-hydroxy-3-methylbut-2-enyl diphosphate reductase [Candidatus Neomarinimicrobiota bacterium]